MKDSVTLFVIILFLPYASFSYTPLIMGKGVGVSLTMTNSLIIHGDGDLLNKTAQFGWSGTGSVLDPIIISNLEIVFDNWSLNAIEISNVSLSIVIKDSFLNGSFLNGISLSNVSSVSVMSLNVTNFSGTGISVKGFGNETFTLEHSFISANGNAIDAYNYSAISISDSQLNGQRGIRCQFSGCGIFRNTISAKTGYGIYINYPFNFEIANNSISSETNGIDIYSYSQPLQVNPVFVVSQNLIVTNYYGITAYFTPFLNITGNTVSGAFYESIYTYYTSNMTIDDNHLEFGGIFVNPIETAIFSMKGNTLAGIPIFYGNGINDMTLTDVSQVFLINSSNIDIDSNILQINTDAITLINSTSISITGSVLNTKKTGITAEHVNGLTVEDLVFSGNQAFDITDSANLILASNLINEESQSRYYSVSNMLIQNNMINGYFGYLYNASHVTIESNRVSNNDFDDYPILDGVLMDMLNIRDNYLSGGEDGFVLDSIFNSTISSNVILESGGTALQFSSSSNVSIVNNIIVNHQTGILGSFSSHVVISDNWAFNTLTGVELSVADTALIFGNDLDGFDFGISLQDISNSSLFSNIFVSPNKISRIKNLSNVSFTFNDFVQSVPFSVMMDSSSGNFANVTFDQNYWSGYEANDTNSDGLADDPYEVYQGVFDNNSHIDANNDPRNDILVIPDNLVLIAEGSPQEICWTISNLLIAPYSLFADGVLIDEGYLNSSQFCYSFTPAANKSSTVNLLVHGYLDLIQSSVVIIPAPSTSTLTSISETTNLETITVTKTAEGLPSFSSSSSVESSTSETSPYPLFFFLLTLFLVPYYKKRRNKLNEN